MSKRFTSRFIGAAAGAAIAALGVGAIAGAQSSNTAPKTPKAVSAPGPARAEAPQSPSADRDKIQSGDQTSRDTPGSRDAKDATAAAAAASSENKSESSSGSESSPETAANSDGPGGHADAPGANVDHQAQGQE